MWDAVADELVRAGRRVVIPDLRGHGDSQKVVGGYDIDLFADDTRAVLRDVGAASVVLVGHSAGGIQALMYAARTEDAPPPTAVLTIGTSVSLDRVQERCRSPLLGDSPVLSVALAARHRTPDGATRRLRRGGEPRPRGRHRSQRPSVPPARETRPGSERWRGNRSWNASTKCCAPSLWAVAIAMPAFSCSAASPHRCVTVRALPSSASRARDTWHRSSNRAP